MTSREHVSSRVVLLSGPVCAGKSTLAMLLKERCGYALVRTRNLLEQRIESAKPRSHRRTLQQLGATLDEEKGGAWVADAVREAINAPGASVVVDAVRTADQITAVRELADVTHIHLTARDDELRARYAARIAEEPRTEFESYDDLVGDETEASVGSLERLADLVVDTSGQSDAVEWIVRRIRVNQDSDER